MSSNLAALSVPVTLDHAGIAARVPHGGRMCLLDTLLVWDTDHARCSIRNHADPAHPLRTARGLLAPVAVEYASQAMALHAALCAQPGSPPRAGFLASARHVVASVPRLDTATGPLVVDVRRLLGDTKQAQYRFRLHDAAGTLLVEGRTTVVLDGVPNDPPHAAGAAA